MEMPVEFVISTRPSSVSLVSMTLHRMIKLTENDANARIELSSGTFDPDGPLLDAEWAVRLSLENCWG